MAQSSLRQFYTVRKRPQEEHGSLKRRKLTEETRLDIPCVGKTADPLSLPLSQPLLVSSGASCKTATPATAPTKRSTRTKSRGRGKQTTQSRRRRKSPPLPATPSIVLPAPPTTEQPRPPSEPIDQSRESPATSHDTSAPQCPTTDSRAEPTKSLAPPLKTTAYSTAKHSTDCSTSSAVEQPSTSHPPSPTKRPGESVLVNEPSTSHPPPPTKRPGESVLLNGGDEDPLLVPSCPKSPKQDTTKHTPKSPDSSTVSLPHAPPHGRSRKNLADRMTLASSNTPTSPSPTHTPHTLTSTPNLGQTPRKAPSRPSARELAMKTLPEMSLSSPSLPLSRGERSVRMATAKTAASRPSPKELAARTGAEMKSRNARQSSTRPVNTESHSSEVNQSSSGDSDAMSSSEAISRLYKLSARELAMPTQPERRRVMAARRAKGKSPAPPTPQLQQFRSFVMESPTKSPSKQPAYQRFHSLAQPATEAPELPLPFKYQVLLDKFRCTDTVVTMLQKRREICTFNKLKQAVKEMTRRKYENRNLAQMDTVYPRSFVFRQEKNIPGIYDHKTYESYQLTVECNVREDGREEKREDGREGRGEQEKVNLVLDSSALLRRRKVFNKNLCEITRRHHKHFLSSLCPPLEIPDHKVLRWHPAFQLDSVPDVEEAELPKPPLTESYTTAQDVLNATQARLAPRVQRALEGVARSSVGAEPARNDGGVSVAPSSNAALRGVSQKLLEKIQQKEVCRVRSDITRDPVKEKKLEMLTRMPQLTSIIRSLFVTEKKAAIPFNTVVEKLRDSHTSCLPPDGIEEHLQFMRESLGGWLTVVEVRKRRFVKINKNTDAQVLNARVEQTRKKLVA